MTNNQSEKDNKRVKYLAIAGCLIYFVILLKLLIFKYPSAMVFEIADGNFVPFKTIFNYLSGEPNWIIAIRNIGGNIILFLPVSFFILFFRRESTWKSVLIIAFIISATLEIIQGAFQAGVFDVDDIILNVCGAIFGFWVFTLLKPIIKERFFVK